MKYRRLDFIDLACIGLVFFVIAKTSPIAILVMGPFWLVQYFARRTLFAERVIESQSITKRLKPILLPDRIDEAIDEAITISDTPQTPFWRNITTPLTEQEIIDDEPEVLRKIPRIVRISDIPDPQTPLAVPIGYGLNHHGKHQWVYADFGSRTIHGLIAGQTGTGKDNILRLWFMALVRNNTPSEVKFVILDGKGEWILPALVNAEHMLYPPVGGLSMVREIVGGKKKWKDHATEDMEDAISEVFEEIERRTLLFRQAGAGSIERYREKTGLPMPLIIIFATDIASNIEELETLFKILSARGRSLGIRLIVSVQSTSNLSTSWRNNLGLVIAGSLQLASQDSPVTGIDKLDNLIFRPSKLPSPKSRPGIFIVREGDHQYIVQVPYLPDDLFEDFYNNLLPQKHRLLSPPKDNNDLLRELLL